MFTMLVLTPFVFLQLPIDEKARNAPEIIAVSPDTVILSLETASPEPVKESDPRTWGEKTPVELFEEQRNKIKVYWASLSPEDRATTQFFVVTMSLVLVILIQTYRLRHKARLIREADNMLIDATTQRSSHEGQTQLLEKIHRWIAKASADQLISEESPPSSTDNELIDTEAIVKSINQAHVEALNVVQKHSDAALEKIETIVDKFTTAMLDHHKESMETVRKVYDDDDD